MINGIVGRPRTGKSYEATRYHIIPTVLNDKRKVVTNIPINLEYIAKTHGQEYADLIDVVYVNFGDYGNRRPFSHEDDFLKYDDWKNEKGQGVLFVIDEVHLTCPRGRARAELLEYYSLHGHYGHDHLILTQNARKIHADLKEMAEIVWRTTKMSAFGKDDEYIQKTYHGFGNLKNSIHEEVRQYDSEWFPYYKSHTLSQTSVTEAHSQEVKGVLNPYKKISMAFMGFGLLVCLFIGYKVYSGFTEEPKPIIKEQIKEVKSDINKQPEIDKNIENTLKKAELPEVKKGVAKTDGKEIKRSVNENQLETIKELSKQYHPFYKVNLHVSGYSSTTRNDQNYYFSASSNGQELFQLTLKDLMLAGYSVQIFGECIIEIKYYKFRDFIICDVPTVSASGPQIASVN